MRRFSIFWLASLAVAAELCGQSASTPPAPARAQIAPPLPSQAFARSPVDLFRELLAMKAPERQAALTNKYSKGRAVIESKLKEFEALSEPEREERLQTLQLRWLLLPLMKLSPAQRGPTLAALSEADRRLIEDRLEQWDRLPGDLQRKVLENENVVRLFIRPQGSAARTDLTLTNLSPVQRAQVLKDQARWQAMSEAERQRVADLIKVFFDLNARQRARILETMGEAERRQMERTLQQFGRLPDSQREACLQGFQKFAALRPQEREEFLKNAERWQAMSSSDRRLWRALVARLQPKPPLPPGARPRPPLPSLPPTSLKPLNLPAAPGQALSTN